MGFSETTLVAFALLGLVVSACTLSDDERCPSGYAFDTETKTCKSKDCGEGFVFNEQTLLCEEIDTGPGTDSGNDTDGEPLCGQGHELGDECDSDGDCTPCVCFKNPLHLSDPGYCTQQDCAPGNCPGGYNCCDCTKSELAQQMGLDRVACVTESDATVAAGAGCECD
ncbi:MAG: hypothetical protein MUC50_08675 [Myxococcota bacterium]|jgi:hypothetical protein|nr:hypothetical protein [Myxococcota bacterium]